MSEVRQIALKIALALTLIATAGGAGALLANAPRHNTPVTPAYQIDITRLPEATFQLPPGSIVIPQPTQTVTQDDVDKFTAALTTLKVTPPECLNMVTANLNQTVGTVATSLSAQNPQFGVVITASQAPRSFVTTAPVAACSTFDVERSDGAVSRTHVLDAPVVADVTKTSATHSITTGGEAGDRVVDQYEYVAALDDRHLVTVTSFANPTDTKAVGDQMPRLLSDAVNAVRWR